MSKKCEHCGDESDSFECACCGRLWNAATPPPAPLPGEVEALILEIDANPYKVFFGEDLAPLLSALAEYQGMLSIQQFRDLQAQLAAKEAECEALKGLLREVRSDEGYSCECKCDGCQDLTMRIDTALSATEART